MGSFGTRLVSRSVAALVVLALACGDDAETCTTDDECPAFHRCLEQQCRPLVTTDAGPRRDSGAIARRDGGSIDADVPDGAMPVGTGRLSVISANDPTGMFGWVAFAEFIPASGLDCVVDRMGSCVYRDCSSDEPFPHAGPIRLSSDGAPSATMLPGSMGLYSSSGSPGLWGDGVPLTASADGDEVPPFDFIVAPPPVLEVRDGELGGVPIRDALLMHFLPEGGATFVGADSLGQTVVILRDLAAPAVREIRCDVPPGPASVEIAFVDELRPASSVLFAVVSVESETRSIGGWTVTVEAMQAADFEGMAAAAVLRVD